MCKFIGHSQHIFSFSLIKSPIHFSCNLKVNFWTVILVAWVSFRTNYNWMTMSLNPAEYFMIMEAIYTNKLGNREVQIIWLTCWRYMLMVLHLTLPHTLIYSLALSSLTLTYPPSSSIILPSFHHTPFHQVKYIPTSTPSMYPYHSGHW